jgi:hypothetical protein
MSPFKRRATRLASAFYSLYVSRAAGTKRPRDLYRSRRFAAFGENDGVDAPLVRERTPPRALGDTERAARRAFPRLLTEASVRDAKPTHERRQLERHLIGDEAVVGEKKW